MELYYKKQKLCVVIVVSFYVVIILPTLLVANVGDPNDPYWKHKAQKAWNNTLDAYEPHPEKVTTQVTKDTAETLNTISKDDKKHLMNNTRRHLKGKRYRGPCKVTNPIDRCWRCQANWANNRKRLADCALGFGRGTTGGKNGEVYVVTDPSDNSLINPTPGTLRHAVIQERPLWIIFSKSMSIRLAQELIMQGDKTIDGRGVYVHIANGAQITLQYIQNVIIHGIHVHNIYSGGGGMIRDSVDHYGFRTRSDGDGISIFGSSKIWIDHVSMSHCSDGMIDAIEASTAITISNCHFTDHNEVMLFGGSDSYSKDTSMQITLAYNHFGKRLVQRMPRCRYGYIHVVNNDYTHWEMYAIGGSKNPTIISQGNRFIAPPNPFAKEVTKRDYSPESVWKNWDWISNNDYFLNGAFFVPSGDPDYIKKHENMLDNMIPSSGRQVAIITKFAGVLRCRVNVPC